jgi:hypothetical protein
VNIRRRLSQLEARARRRRCAACRDWPDTRVTVVYEDDDGTMTPHPPYWQGRTSDPSPEPELPARCPGCGWEPDTVTFRITYDRRPPGQR